MKILSSSIKSLLILCVFGFVSLIQAAPVSQERAKANKEHFERKKKVKKAAPAKIGTSNKLKTKISEDAPLTLLDESQAIVSTISPEKAQVVTTVITMQDVNRQGFDGGKYNCEDLINFALMDHLSQDMKINVTTDDINRYCQKMGLSKDQIKYISDSNWFPSIDDFYELFKKNYRGRMAMNFLVDSQIVISEEEIKKYWQDNPIWLEPIYFVEIVTIPLNGKSLEEFQKELAAKEKRNNLTDIHWQEPVKILDSELGENNKFVAGLKIGDVYIQPEDKEVTLYRLQNKEPKRRKPLEERKKEITNHLKMKKSFKVEQEEREKLKNNALIYKSKQSRPVNTKELVG